MTKYTIEGRFLRNIELGTYYKKDYRKNQVRVKRTTLKTERTGPEVTTWRTQGKTRHGTSRVSQDTGRNYLRQRTCIPNKGKMFIVMVGQGNRRHPRNRDHQKDHGSDTKRVKTTRGG